MQKRNRGNNGYTGIVGNIQEMAVTKPGANLQPQRRAPRQQRRHDHSDAAPPAGGGEALYRRWGRATRSGEPDLYLVRPAHLLMSRDADWLEGTAEHRTAFHQPVAPVAIAGS